MGHAIRLTGLSLVRRRGDHEMSEDDGLSAPVASAPTRRFCQGPVMPIGGAEETERGGDGYATLFRKMGAKEADWLRVERREDANAEPALALLREATGIYISGGDQSRLVRLLVGTLTMECIRMRNADGVIVAGTSAGASILSALMMAGGTGVGGDSNGAAARKGMIDIVAGFGLLQDNIIDQHFSQRGRMGRLLSVFAGTPGLIGIGLDEDTAVLIDREGTLEVL